MLARKIGTRVLTLAVLSFPQYVLAAGWDLNTTVNTQVVHNDNIYLLLENEQDVTGAVFNPGLRVNRTEPDGRLSLGADISLTRYQDEPLFDRDEGQLDVSWLKKTERSSIGIDALYSKYSSLNQNLETSGLTNQPIDVLTSQVSPSWNYQLAETWWVGLTYTYVDTEYDEPGLEGFDNFKVVNFINFNADTLKLVLSKLITTRDKISLETKLTRYEGESGGLQVFQNYLFYYSALERELEYDYLEYKLGYIHEFSETQKISLAAGGGNQDVTSRIREHYFQNATEFAVDDWLEEKESKKTSVYSIDYNISGELSDVVLSVGRDRTTDSTGGLVQLSFARLSYGRSLTERLRASFLASREEREIDQATSVVVSGDRTRSVASAAISYQLSRQWSVSTQYRYLENDRDLDPDSATSNAVYLSLNWKDKSFY